MVEDLAGTNIPVLLVGESGTGKEVYARLIHWLSTGNTTPLKRIACTARDASRLQLELREQLEFEEPAKETRNLFLDGVEEMDSACQRLLLTFLLDRGDWSGGPASRTRLISATSRDLEKEVETGRFRRELYFRINGACLRLPPLRERKEDIGAFLEHFLQKHAHDLKKTAPQIDQETMGTLMAYDWPGNIREMENLAKKMVALGNTQLAVNDVRLQGTDRSSVPNLEKGLSLKIAARAASRERERVLILEALGRTRWNRKHAAKELQISYKALLYKLKQIGTPGKGTQK